MKKGDTGPLEGYEWSRRVAGRGDPEDEQEPVDAAILAVIGTIIVVLLAAWIGGA